MKNRLQRDRVLAGRGSAFRCGWPGRREVLSGLPRAGT